MQQEDVCGIIVTFLFWRLSGKQRGAQNDYYKAWASPLLIVLCWAMRRPRIAEWAADAVPTLSFYRVLWKYYQ